MESLPPPVPTPPTNIHVTLSGCARWTRSMSSSAGCVRKPATVSKLLCLHCTEVCHAPVYARGSANNRGRDWGSATNATEVSQRKEERSGKRRLQEESGTRFFHWRPGNSENVNEELNYTLYSTYQILCTIQYPPYPC